MAYDEVLALRIRDLLRDCSEVSEKKMFGGLAFMLNDYNFCGINDDRLMVRVGAERYGEALEQKHVRPMDFTGRPLKGYVYVEGVGLKSDDALKGWVQKGVEFVESLPPKKAAKKRKKRRI